MMTKSMRVAGLLALLAFTGGRAEAAGSTSDLVNWWFEERDLVLPAPEYFQVCHGFGCAYRTRLRLSRGDIAELRRIMSAGEQSAEAERQAIARSEIWFSNRLSNALGRARQPGWHPDKAFVEGEMDCLDVATNTTLLLVLLDRMSLLRHHSVQRPVARGVFVYGAHATAVLEDRSNGAAWAIDPWHNAPGTPADILPIDQWYAELGGGHTPQAATIPEPAREAAPARRSETSRSRL